MKYIDTGSRDPEQALGAWLKSVLDGTVVALRCQTGFFSANALGLFASTFADLQKRDLPLNVLVGSNDGTTTRADLEGLLALSGPSRKNRRIGVVSFDRGYFHPKTIHITRADGSTAGYVGSANLTESGTASLHIEAGVVLDSRGHDDTAVLKAIASAIDWWFQRPRDGLNIVHTSADLDPLVKDGVLDVPTPSGPARPAPSAVAGAKQRRGFVLRNLLNLPASPAGVGTKSSLPKPGLPGPSSAPTPTSTARWSKPLTRSDAQRKPSGNQRGSITLVRSRYAIDAQSYFRHEFFANAAWKAETTQTGEKRETAIVPFQVTILGKKLGVRQIMITHAPNRESGQANYTSLLHLRPALAPHFTKTDFTGKWLDLERLSDGSYALRIQDSQP